MSKKLPPGEKKRRASARQKLWRDKNREILTLKRKRYYADHREERLADNKRWQEENREKRRLYYRKYYAKNREKKRAYGRLRAMLNRDESRDACRRYAAMNREAIKLTRHLDVDMATARKMLAAIPVRPSQGR